MQARVAGFLNGIHAISGLRQYKRYLIVSIFQPYCMKCFQTATRGRGLFVDITTGNIVGRLLFLIFKFAHF